MHEVAICNKALLKLGASPITTFQDNTAEARLCRDQYNIIRDSVLEMRPWRFALDRRELPKYTWPVDRPRPMGASENCYALPPECLRVLAASSSASHNWDDDTVWSQEGHHIYAVADYLVVKYIYRNENCGHYSPTFIDALATRLASEFAMTLTGSASNAEKIYQQYLRKLSTASVVDTHVGNRRRSPGRLVRAREA